MFLCTRNPKSFVFHFVQISGRTVRHFVPISKILKPVLVECVTPFSCYWSLSLIVRGEEELLPVFKGLYPPVKMLVPIWKALCVAIVNEERNPTLDDSLPSGEVDYSSIQQLRMLVSKIFISNSRFDSFRRWLRAKPSYPKNKIKKYEGDRNNGHAVQLLKSRGQHLLTNSRILDAIVSKSSISPEDTVLEIGPGTGNLTLKLLEVAKKVVAIEIDKRMVDVLGERVAQAGLQDRLNLICGDALKTDFPEFNLVVANIPYGISSPLLAKLVFGLSTNPFRSATLLLQKEFAKRLLANHGDSEFNRLAVNMKLLADIEFVMDVSKRDFVPCPKVDSSVVKIYPKIKIPDVDLNEWWALTRTCFGKKNKTLGAIFKQKKKLMELMKASRGEGLKRESNRMYDEGDLDLSSSASTSLFREKIIGLLESNGFLDKRPSKLCNDEFLRLLCLLNRAGIYFHDYGKQNGSCDPANLASDDDPL
ncbi:putative dimethyladenosine transferase [Dorcoceras hygrometricum]|uniref:rRNA adenine N(6)-methyltransferase n=1 Tax=Dorcoceras hygrometricum TaxID=472368 RepID=A0A2Z7AX87_9LAMI|nr:putative dimethyladenosine transferase [Dorcoceras hygrometricum]